MRTKLTGILTLVLAFSVQMIFAQSKTITGTVSDQEGLPLPGVNIRVKGTDQGTQTDFNGKYSLEAEQGKTLIFSYVGFSDKEIQVGAKSTVDVSMEESASELDKVVVTGYGTTTERKSTAASTTITAEEIEDRPNASLINSMQGEVSGLNIGTNSGRPGGDSQIILRGVGSLNGNVEPLFVIDGVPVDEDNFRSLNPNNIESVSVLKDAAATSIYGNRGANGVVVINTKGGNYDQQLTFKYNAQYGFSELPPLNLDLMNSRQKLTFERDNGIEDGRGFGLSDAEIDAVAKNTNTRWEDYFFRKAPTNSQNLTISSGSKNTTNFTSIGYLEQQGTFEQSELQRFSFRNNFSGRTDDKKFTYKANINVNLTKDSYTDNGASNSVYFNPFFNSLRGLPYLSPFDADGSQTIDGGIETGNPDALQGRLSPYVLLNSMHYNNNDDEELKAVGNISANWNFADNWTLGGRFGIDYTNVRNNFLLHPNSILGPLQTDTAGARTEFGGVETNSSTRDARMNTNINLNYNVTWDDVHTIDANVYTEYNRSYFDGINFRQEGLNAKNLGNGSAYIPGTTIDNFDPTVEDDQYPYIPSIGRTNIETGLFSYFGTVDYDYDGRFGFFGSIRRDATFRFVDDNEWGTFYSVSGRWNLDQESWMQDTDFNLLKLRASFGTSGNQRIEGPYYSGNQLYTTTFNSGTGYNNTAAFALNNLGNPNLQWEKSEQLNVGVDFALNNNKFQGTVDLFQKKTSDLFQDRRVSPITSQTGVNSNVGSMRNRGVEMNFKYTVIDSPDWRLQLKANASYTHNEVLELSGANDDGIIPPDSGGNVALGEGEAVGSYYVVDYAGVNPANGNPLFRDADGNLTETLDPQNDRQFSDHAMYPKWQGGFGGTLSYKNFSLSTQWVFFADIYRANADLAALEGSASLGSQNKSTSLLNAWKQPGDITNIPRLNGPYGYPDYINQTDRYLTDASYLRLRNLTLGYSLDDEILEKTPFTKLKIFVQGENLLTFSKWQGYDAESDFRNFTSDRFPTPKIYTLGLNVNF